MNAREYFNKHGYKHCKSACIQNGWLNTGFWVQLKRLIESWELVEKLGGINKAKDYVPDGYKSEQLKQAIADVESCLETDKKLEGL